jgi:hypothetical protein
MHESPENGYSSTARSLSLGDPFSNSPSMDINKKLSSPSKNI